LRSVEDRRAQAVAAAAEIDATAQAHRAHKDRLTERAAHFDSELTAARERHENESRRSSQLREAQSDLEHELARAHAEAKRTAQARDAAAQAVERSRDEVASKRTSAMESAARLRALQDIESGGHARPPGVTAVLDAGANGTLRGIVGTVADSIDVDQPYARAIDVGMGTHAHAVITQTGADAQAAIEHLKQNSAGRATFLPLEAVRQQELPLLVDVGRRAGVIGQARDLVHCKDDVRPAIDYVLAGVVVADALPAAQKLAREFSHAMIVTLAGDVVFTAAITGGSREDEKGPMARRAAIAELERALATAQAAAAESEAALARARAALDEAGRTAERAAQAALDTHGRRQDARVALERSAAESSALERQIGSLQTEGDEARVALEKVATLWRTHDERGAVAHAAVETLETERRSAGTTSDTLQHALNDVRELHRVSAAESAALVERVALAGDDVERARGEVIERRKAHAARVEGVGHAKAEIDRAEKDLAAADERRTQADAGLLEAERDAEALRGERDALANAARELEERLAAEQSQTQERSLELERHRIRLAEIDAELSVLAQTFAQNPATPQECDDVAARYASFEGDADADIRRLRDELARLGGVNLNALEDQATLLERRDFLRKQLADLEQARASILAVIAEIDAESVRQFNAVFEQVAVAFSEMFSRLFAGGVGKIWLAESDDPALAGVEIAAQPPGKKMQSLNALSGGERSLAAVALIFAILKVRPSPFYIFDEIDAALDEANIGRFGQVLSEFANKAQIVIITHNKATMTLADRIYGVTMGEPGVSSLLSLALEQVGA